MNFKKLHTTYCRVIVFLVFSFAGILSSHAQYSIDGPTSVYQNSFEIYTVTDYYGQPPNNYYNTYFSWYSSNGSLQSGSGNGMYQAYLFFNTISYEDLYVDWFDNYTFQYYYLQTFIQVNPLPPSTPSAPTVLSNNCNSTTLQRGTPPTGVTWYWQSTATGTSTSSSSATKTVTSGTIYYLRAKNISSGVWSTNSSSVEYTIDAPPVWYADTDNDGFGDPNISTSNCTQPSNYVSNNFDECPTQTGNPLNNGCPGDGDLGSTDKNYVHTITPLIPVSNISQITNDEDKIEGVTYFDGLGRAIQSVGIRAGGNKRDNNLIDWKNNWALGSGSAPFYSQNGSTIENERIMGTDPYGDTSMLWECGNESDYGSDGGWNSTYFSVDKTMGYRYTVWVKRTGSQDGRTYHGTHSVNNLSGTANGNPYFFNGDLPNLNQWYLIVGIIHPHTYGTSSSGISGVYDVNGNKVLGGTDFKWMSTTTTANFRSYLYYATDTSVRQYFYDPIVQRLDGNEASIDELINEPIGKDIKTPLVYDEFGRQTKTYLSHGTVTSSVGTYTPNTTLISDLNTYYVSIHSSQLNSGNPNTYAEKRFDDTPLSRTLESGSPGEDWLINPNSDSDHTTKYDYNSNVTNEVYKIDYPGAGQSLSISLYYAQGVLLKNTVKNENWVTSDGKVNTKDVFTDKSGKKIAEHSYIIESSVLKTLKTYYVYDNPGNLMYILTPKLFTIISGTTISVTNLNDLAFQYKYDTYNRQIEQKVPGKKLWEYMVYDQLDRPILTQDENLKDDSKWLFTKYDAFGRAAYSGLFTSSSSRSALQTAVDSYISGNTNNLSNIESRTTSTSSIGGISINYSNNAYPITGLEVLTVNYYDDYTFTDSNKPSTPTTILGQTVTTRTKGLPTASWTKTLGASSWAKNYSYYDEKGGVIYIYEKNYLNGYTENKSKLDFRGKVETSTTTHRKGASGSILTIEDRFDYDHVERPKSHYQIVNSNPEERISKNNYNELGQLIEKGIGGTLGISLQILDYAYDIRGALKGVNDVDNIGNDLFAYELNYESGEGTNFNAPQYNGNISQMVWKSAYNNTKKSYYYDYDDLNRFKKGRYGEGSGLTSNWQKFEVSVNGYDHNGNITGLTRKGGSTGSTIDNLTYYYDTGNGNQLMKIIDASGVDGFTNGTNGGDDYAYDDNGNLTKDLNKNISLIEYNHLDLVTKVTFTDGKRIEFLYDAAGAKLQMAYINGGTTTTTNYIGGFQYLGNTLQFFATSEGYVDYDNGSYSYVYSLKDHLGNNRVSFKNVSGNNNIISNTDYYPMGLTHYGELIQNSNYNYKYQNKEQLLANGYNMYDFGSRMYDASVGRWFNTDPQNQFNSPYLAMGNNPISVVDPDGELAWFIPIIAGALIGGVNTAIQNPSADFSDIFNGALLGGGFGAITSGVGGLTSGISNVGTQALVSSGIHGVIQEGFQWRMKGVFYLEL